MIKGRFRSKGDTSLLRRIAAGLRSGPTKVRVGFPDGAGVPSEILMRATFAEFGTSRSPERPMLRNAMADNAAKHERMLTEIVTGIVEGSIDSSGRHAALTRLGIVAQGDIQKTIQAGNFAPNAASTIARKGSSSPLTDTGAMAQAVTFKAED